MYKRQMEDFAARMKLGRTVFSKKVRGLTGHTPNAVSYTHLTYFNSGDYSEQFRTWTYGWY